MSIITPKEVKDLTALNCLDNDLHEIISSAEVKAIIPVITKPVLDDIPVNPIIYDVLVRVYIKPYLAYYVKLQYYTQNFSETIVVEMKEVAEIVEAKRKLLVNHLATGIYPLYVVLKKKQISGFLIK